MTNAVSIGQDVNIGGYDGVYTKGGGQVSVDEISFNAVNENLTILEVKGYGSTNECWGNHTGVYTEEDGFNGVLCRVNLGTGDDKLYIVNVVNSTTNITLLNQSGDMGSYAIKYNSTGGGKINLYHLENKTGECNYGIENLSGRNIKAVSFPFNNTVHFNDCNVTLYLNRSSQTPVWVKTEEDVSVGNLAMASAVAGMLTIILYKAYQWDSITT